MRPMSTTFVLLMLLLLISSNGCQPKKHDSTLTQSVIPTLTIIPRWILYEKALSNAIVQTDDGLCEWEILGKSENEVYLWAKCKVREPVGTAGSVPAVIYLGKNGEINQIAVPRDGFFVEDVVAMFPTDIQTKIFNRDLEGFADMEHLVKRLKSGGPPLIVVSGTPQP